MKTKLNSQILESIFNVDQNDTKALDMLDAYVRVYVENKKWIPTLVEDDRAYYQMGDEHFSAEHRKYTRSRDALKRIRPDGFIFDVTCYVGGFGCHAYDGRDDTPYWENYKNTLEGELPDLFPTEELAELHAIILAIEYERNRIKEIEIPQRNLEMIEELLERSTKALAYLLEREKIDDDGAITLEHARKVAHDVLKDYNDFLKDKVSK